MSELIFFLIVFILGIVGTGVGIILLINGEEFGLSEGTDFFRGRREGLVSDLRGRL